jgi:hypothetical protein
MAATKSLMPLEFFRERVELLSSLEVSVLLRIRIVGAGGVSSSMGAVLMKVGG